MGQEATCVAQFGGKRVRGKVLLESTEILFRGEARLKIPFTAIKQLTARGGQLRVKTADRLLVFELGEQAEKWRDKILNPKSLLDKLGVKPGEQVVLHGSVDRSFRESLIKNGAKVGTASQAEWTFLAANAREQLSAVDKIRKNLHGTAALWIVYPKGQKTITESDVRGTGLKAGLVDVKVASFSATHTALKFVIPKNQR